MNKGTDFYGEAIADVIEEACRALGRPREQLDIAVLETGSTGIFGLCKKKAHIRVQVKPEARGLKAAKTAPAAGEAEAGRKKSRSKPEKAAEAEASPERQDHSVPTAPPPVKNPVEPTRGGARRSARSRLSPRGGGSILPCPRC